MVPASSGIAYSSPPSSSSSSSFLSSSSSSSVGSCARDACLSSASSSFSGSDVPWSPSSCYGAEQCRNYITGKWHLLLLLQCASPLDTVWRGHARMRAGWMLCLHGFQSDWPFVGMKCPSGAKCPASSHVQGRCNAWRLTGAPATPMCSPATLDLRRCQPSLTDARPLVLSN
jgi:hypothetical protein